MSEQQTEQKQKSTKEPKPQGVRPTPIGRMTLAEVDAGLTECDRVIKANSDMVKAKLSGSGAIPPTALRDLSRANIQKGRLALRRVALLMDAGDATATELIDKLLKLRPTKA